MTKEFSEGFLHDVADLLEMCQEGNTNSIAATIDVNGTTLQMDIVFSAYPTNDTLVDTLRGTDNTPIN